MYTAGDKPGKGRYVCAKCREGVRLDSEDEPLPVCPKCKGKTYDSKVDPDTDWL